MLAEYGTLSLADVLAPAIQMADGYPIEAQTANAIEQNKAEIKQWRYSREVYLPHAGAAREAPEPGEIFRQPDLAATLRKLVAAERAALKEGRAARRRSGPPTTGSTGATSRASWSVECRRKAA
jgi:gamma-glutamyltranspeptidase/glutathione hydrolase